MHTGGIITEARARGIAKRELIINLILGKNIDKIYCSISGNVIQEKPNCQISGSVIQKKITKRLNNGSYKETVNGRTIRGIIYKWRFKFGQ